MERKETGKTSGMTRGFLWYGDSSTPLEEKVRQAAGGYQEEFGHRPTVCYVRAVRGKTMEQVDGIRVLPAANLLPGYLWLGVVV